MADRVVFVCSCEETMPIDAAAIARGCGGRVREAEQLCAAQLDRFKAALGEGVPVTVGCTAMAPVFAEAAEDAGAEVPLTFVDIRELAGWSREAKRTGPKMAGMLAAAAEPMPPVALVPMKSAGVALVLGRDVVAIDAAAVLAEKLDVTVLLDGREAVEPRTGVAFPVLAGRVRAATGWLGAFELMVDGYARPRPSSRTAYEWGPPRDGAKSTCDVVVDLRGGPALFHETRQGYLRADPADAAAVERVVRQAGELVGEFDQPRFVAFEAGLCAHGRNRKTGCTRCLDLCPTGAITPGKDSVILSAEICAGCGACAAVCPTGAAQYALPPAEAMARRVRTMLLGYAEAGGRDAVVLFHDAEHGLPLLTALGRFGDGLPANVLPVKVNAVSSLDLGLLVAPLAWGAGAVRVLMPARRAEGAEGLLRNFGYAAEICAGLGLGADRVAGIERDDPFALGADLYGATLLRCVANPSRFLALGAPRELLAAALSELHRAVASDVSVVPLGTLAPLGAAVVDAAGCTLCLACTSACPVGAFTANPATPELRFQEDACVQCGLCVATCPEKVISLAPRVNFAPEAKTPVVVKAEAPAVCTRCAKPFGTASSIARVKQKLAGHWMFADPARLAVLELCEECRMVTASEGGIDPYAGPTRPVTKTTEDWMREAERAKRREEE
ncbi:4Fe-4S dicluster domain-containing protein [Plastoroseomonas arctica]|nr:4Fe-4S dicluster domain-containing protein [Plastoroseomonas arctica]